MTATLGRVRGHVVAVAVVALCCAGAATAARSPNPRFNVTVTSTYVRHHITHIVRKADESGCRRRNDIDTTQRITAVSERPAPMTLSDLVRGGRYAVRLDTKEARTGTLRAGWEEGCPLLADQPAYFGDTIGCGQRSWAISLSKTAVGYAGGDNFRFSYGLSLPDPFDGHCLIDFYRGDSAADVLTVNFPPKEWLSGKTKRRWWTKVPRARLLAGKTVVVRWKDSATVDVQPTIAPEAYDQTVYRDTYTLSWAVTLKPAK